MAKRKKGTFSGAKMVLWTATEQARFQKQTAELVMHSEVLCHAIRDLRRAVEDLKPIAELVARSERARKANQTRREAKRGQAPSADEVGGCAGCGAKFFDMATALAHECPTVNIPTDAELDEARRKDAEETGREG